MPNQPEFEQDPQFQLRIARDINNIFSSLASEDSEILDWGIASTCEPIPNRTIQLTACEMPSYDFKESLKSTMFWSGSVAAASVCASAAFMRTREFASFGELLRDTGHASTIVFAASAVTFGVHKAISKFRVIDRSV